MRRDWEVTEVVEEVTSEDRLEIDRGCRRGDE